jgi:hypothetical protein
MHCDEFDRLAGEARAEILWGTPEKEVRSSLKLRGVAPDAAAHVVRIAMTERAKIIAGIARRYLIIGGLLLAGAIGLVVAIQTGEVGGRGVLMLTLLGGCGGVWLLLGGVERMLKGASFRGSLSAVDDYDCSGEMNAARTGAFLPGP